MSSAHVSNQLSTAPTATTSTDTGHGPADADELRSILELARFAASAENAQPWRVEPIDHERIRVHVASGLDERFDPDGTVTQLAAGGFLQSIRIAASNWGRSTDWTVSSRPCTPAAPFTIDVVVATDSTIQVDPLVEFLAVRSVERSPYQRTPLTASQVNELTDSLIPNLTVRWLSTAEERFAVARLNAKSTRVRLATRDAFETNQRTLDWDNPLSTYGVPVDSLGIDRLTRKIFRWSMKSWSRAAFLARIPGNAVGVQVQLELVPGLLCAAHFVLSAAFNAAGELNSESAVLETTLGQGEAIQRFWLTATQLGLSIQPGYAAIALSHPETKANVVQRRFAPTFGVPRDSAVFAGRIGTAGRSHARNAGRRVRSRSMRLTLDQLAFITER